MLLNFTNAKVIKIRDNAIESTIFLLFRCFSCYMSFPSESNSPYVPPYQTRCKLGENPFLHRLCTDFGTEEEKDKRRFFLFTSYLIWGLFVFLVKEFLPSISSLNMNEKSRIKESYLICWRIFVRYFFILSASLWSMISRSSFNSSRISETWSWV